MLRTLWVGLLACVSIASFAGEGDDFRSCYDIFEGEVKAKAPQSELFVLLDQTINLDQNLKSMVSKKIHGFIEPGRKLTIILFSTYEGDKYTKRLVSGQFDFPLNENELYSISKTNIRRFESCLKKQSSFANKKINEALMTALNSADKNIPNSEIVGNLSRIAESLIAKSKTPNKSILLVSDMLENSENLSFYKNGSVSLSSPENALKKVQGSDLLSDFLKSKVYVLGAGFNSNGYQNATTMKKINFFWASYFKASNAVLIGWGQPELFEDVQ